MVKRYQADEVSAPPKLLMPTEGDSRKWLADIPGDLIGPLNAWFSEAERFDDEAMKDFAYSLIFLTASRDGRRASQVERSITARMDFQNSLLKQTFSPDYSAESFDGIKKQLTKEIGKDLGGSDKSRWKLR